MASALVRAAVSGIFAGLAIACSAPSSNAPSVTVPVEAVSAAPSVTVVASPAPPPTSSPAPFPSSDRDCCRGKNDCKGLSGCATSFNDCAGKNECKGTGSACPPPRDTPALGPDVPAGRNCCAGKNDCKGKSACRTKSNPRGAGWNDCKGRGTNCRKR